MLREAAKNVPREEGDAKIFVFGGQFLLIKLEGGGWVDELH